jgi:hypothetical protein
MRDERRPMSQDEIDERAKDARAFRTAAFAVAFFSGVVLINGVVVILLIALLQTLGLWEADTTETTSLSVTSDGIRSTITGFLRRPTTQAIEP